jgi:zinc/manganese transport system substrate-binding protein
MLKLLVKAGLSGGLLLSGFGGLALADGLKVVASFSILGDMAKQVGGDKVAVTTLVGPDSDAHVYEPKPADAAAMAEADVVLINGLGFEGFIERLATASGTKATIATVARGVSTLEGEHGGVDPHAFQSVPDARIYVTNIAAAFCAADVSGCDGYKANAAAYDAQLAILDKDIRAAVAAIPADRRTVITSHDAFGYLAHEYGLVFLAPEGISTDSEASAADVARLIDQIRGAKASALFVETISDPRLVNQISAETGIKIGGALYSDALSAAAGPAATYIDMMRHNIETIKGAILGK